MITAGEMLDYTKRFKEIVQSKACQELKNSRLAAMMSDLEIAYSIPVFQSGDYKNINPQLMQLYRTVSEARG